MKAILLSIRPNWCKLIWSGMKTVEVRKTRPKLETPFKVYIYCTGREEWIMKLPKTGAQKMSSRVIGEFTCNYIAPIFRYAPWIPGEPAKLYARCADGHCRKGYTDQLLRDACLNRADVEKYFGDLNGLAGYGWRISDLKIYDKPKSILDFHRAVDKTELWCEKCAIGGKKGTACAFCYGLDGLRIRRPPQSYCYVEELECT